MRVAAHALRNKKDEFCIPIVIFFYHAHTCTHTPSVPMHLNNKPRTAMHTACTLTTSLTHLLKTLWHEEIASCLQMMTQKRDDKVRAPAAPVIECYTFSWICYSDSQWGPTITSRESVTQREWSSSERRGSDKLKLNDRNQWFEYWHAAKEYVARKIPQAVCSEAPEASVQTFVWTIYKVPNWHAINYQEFYILYHLPSMRKGQ